MTPYQPDNTDFGIMNLLQKDGLMTYKELASKLKKTINPIVERIRRLKQLGYIKDTVALININQVKSVFIAFPHVQLINHSEEVINQFKEDMVSYTEVMECYHLTGHFDFMLKIIMPDMVSYNNFLREKLGSLPYVGSIQSFLVLSEVKHETAYPL